MRVLVTGAQGQLGRACIQALTDAGHSPIGVDLPDGDLSIAGVAHQLLTAHEPASVLHCAAYTAVDRAESERDLALAGNTTATQLLAQACEAVGCELTYVSTDYVFAGDAETGYPEDAVRRPINWYGETKARAEEAVEELTVPWRIVRTSWLFGHGPANFVKTMRRLVAERSSLSVVDDQRGCPTYAPDLATLLVRMLDVGARGHFHGTNQGVCTWYEFAREIARLSGLAPERIAPCTTADFPTPAKRPSCSVLLETRLSDLGITPCPAWEDALARYVTWLDADEESASR